MEFCDRLRPSQVTRKCHQQPFRNFKLGFKLMKSGGKDVFGGTKRSFQVSISWIFLSKFQHFSRQQNVLRKNCRCIDCIRRQKEPDCIFNQGTLREDIKGRRSSAEVRWCCRVSCCLTHRSVQSVLKWSDSPLEQKSSHSSSS